MGTPWAPGRGGAKGDTAAAAGAAAWLAAAGVSRLPQLAQNKASGSTGDAHWGQTTPFFSGLLPAGAPQLLQNRAPGFSDTELN